MHTKPIFKQSAICIRIAPSERQGRKIRSDQYEKLQELAIKIADVAIFDADPENWIGANTAPKDLTKEARGDAYWCRKLAVSSLSVLMRVQNAIGAFEIAGSTGQLPVEDSADSGLDADVQAAEKEAKKLLAQLNTRTKDKEEFDKHVHGKKA